MIDDYYVPVDKLRIQDVDITGSFNQITYGVSLGSKVCIFSGTEIILIPLKLILVPLILF